MDDVRDMSHPMIGSPDYQFNHPISPITRSPDFLGLQKKKKKLPPLNRGFTMLSKMDPKL